MNDPDATSTSGGMHRPSGELHERRGRIPAWLRVETSSMPSGLHGER